MGRLRLAATLAAFAAVAAALAGCAPPRVPYDRAAAPQVRTIGVVTPNFPTGPTVVLATSVGQSFGLIGALIDAGMQADRDSRFGGAMRERQFDAHAYFLERLAEALRARGYAVEMVPVQRTREHFEFLAAYPTASPPKVDAYPDLVVTAYGYIAAGIGPSTPYRPYIAVRARLANAADGAVLMQDVLIYNAVGPAAAQQQVVTLAPDPAHRFDKFDDLMADPDVALKGVQVAAEQLAQAIAALLR